MVSVLAVLLVIALVVWLLMKFVPGPGWVSEVAFVSWVVIATLMMAGIRLEMGT